MKEFAAAEKLCVRQVKYRFCFTDLDPTESHSDPYEHGFAFFTFGPYEKALQLQKGLLVVRLSIQLPTIRLVGPSSFGGTTTSDGGTSCMRREARDLV